MIGLDYPIAAGAFIMNLSPAGTALVSIPVLVPFSNRAIISSISYS